MVLTGQQEAWATKGGPGKFWEDKCNSGYSGTPLWKLNAERQAMMEQSAGSGPRRVPEGFVKQRGGGDMYWSEKKQHYWKESDGKFYTYDELAQKHVELHEAQTHDISISVGGVCHERGTQVRNVIVRDLARAAQALRLSVDHLDQPVALYALYDGHRGQAENACADFCAKHLHGKLLPKLAAFRGFWVDERLRIAMRECFEELEAAFAEKHPGSREGCSAAVALVIGDRLVVANVGDIACCGCERSGETFRLVKPHLQPGLDESDEDDEEEAAGGSSASTAAAAASSQQLKCTRAFGNLDLKGPAKGEAAMSHLPEVSVLKLEHQHNGFAFVCRALYNSIGGSAAVSTVFKRSAGRPRMAAGALVDAAVQWMGQVGQDSLGLASVVAFVETRPSASVGTSAGSGVPAAKRRKTEETTQVRLRHILLKHKECKSTIDKVRNKQVKRTRGEAERSLRRILEECESDPQRKVFTQRCRELSECQSCLKAGDLAGDLSWVKRGSNKMGEAFEQTAFGLQVNQMSDLIDSDQGVHVVLRTA